MGSSLSAGRSQLVAQLSMAGIIVSGNMVAQSPLPEIEDMTRISVYARNTIN